MGKKPTAKSTVAPANPVQVPASGSADSVSRLLLSANHNHRIDACNAIAGSVSREHLPTLQNTGCLATLVKLLEDKMITVAIAAAGALRNICVEGGADAGRLLAPHRVTASVLSLLTVLAAAFAAPLNDKGRVVPAEGAAPLHWYAATHAQITELFTQTIALQSSLCESSVAATDEFTAAQAASSGAQLTFILERCACLLPSSDVAVTPADVSAGIDALTFLRVATASNSTLCAALAGQPAVTDILIAIAAQPAATESLNADTYAPALGVMRDALVKQLRRSQGAVTDAMTLARPRPLAASAATAAAAVVVNVVHSLLTGPAAAAVSAEMVTQWITAAAGTLAGAVASYDVNANLAHLTRALARVQELLPLAQSGALVEMADAGTPFPVGCEQADASTAPRVRHGAAAGEGEGAEDEDDDGSDSEADEAIAALEAGTEPMPEGGDVPADLVSATGATFEELEAMAAGSSGPAPKRGPDLPLDMMWSSAMSSLIRQFSAPTLAVRTAVDALSTLLSLLPHAQEAAAAPAAVQALYALLPAVFSAPVAAADTEAGAATATLLERAGSLCALRILPSSALAAGAAEAAVAADGHAHALLTSVSSEALSATLALVSKHGLQQLGEVCDVLRTQACVCVFSATMFLPAAAFGASDEAVAAALTSLLGSIGAVTLSHDVAPVVAPAVVPATARALAQSITADAPEPAVAFGQTSAEELEALTGALLHLLKRPEIKALNDAAWAQLLAAPAGTDAAALPLVAAAPVAEPALMARLAAFLTAPGLTAVTSDLRAHAAGALAALGCSPAAGAGNAAAITKALLDGLAAAAQAGKTSGLDLNVVYEIVMGLIDMYSEDDRYTAQYKEAGVTAKLATFAPAYTLAFKEAKKKHAELVKKRSGRVATTVTAEDVAQSEAALEKASEGVENIGGFVGYKRGLKL
jgi:hypothetical protein